MLLSTLNVSTKPRHTITDPRRTGDSGGLLKMLKSLKRPLKTRNEPLPTPMTIVLSPGVSFSRRICPDISAG